MPTPAGPPGISRTAWAPDLVKVADRVPGRTLIAVGGANVQEYTFGPTTRPTDQQVLRLIDDSVAWVQAATGSTIDASLTGLATAAAAIYTAAAVELGYPERDSANEKDAQATAAALFRQADDMLAKLAARNDVLIGENPEVFEIVPVWSFPPGLPDDFDFGFEPSVL